MSPNKRYGSPLDRALSRPGCERLRDFVQIGPAQRAALELFVSALSAQEPVAYVDLAKWFNSEAAKPNDCFSECPVGDCTTALYAAPPAQPGTVAVPRDKLIQCMKTLDADGDEHGVAALMDHWLSAAPKGSGHE